MSKYLPLCISELKEAILKNLLVVLSLLTTFGLLAIAVTTLPLITDWDSIILEKVHKSQSLELDQIAIYAPYRDWETDRKSTRLNSSHRL